MLVEDRRLAVGFKSSSGPKRGPDIGRTGGLLWVSGLPLGLTQGPAESLFRSCFPLET